MQADIARSPQVAAAPPDALQSRGSQVEAVQAAMAAKGFPTGVSPAEAAARRRAEARAADGAADADAALEAEHARLRERMALARTVLAAE